MVIFRPFLGYFEAAAIFRPDRGLGFPMPRGRAVGIRPAEMRRRVPLRHSPSAFAVGAARDIRRKKEDPKKKKVRRSDRRRQRTVPSPVAAAATVDTEGSLRTLSQRRPTIDTSLDGHRSPLVPSVAAASSGLMVGHNQSLVVVAIVLNSHPSL